MSRERITVMLTGMAERHIGGVFIHPRPGLITEYLSHEWFKLWKFALSECQRLGLGCHIYDENSFPSGFAGGHVASADPRSANSRLGAYFTHAGETTTRSGTRLACLERSAADVTYHQVSSPSTEGSSPALSLELESFAPRLWNAGFSMVDVCRADVTRRFLAVTHERYAEHFNDHMGGAIKYVFTDEPETGTSARGFHLSRALLHEFREDHGYPLESRLDALCGETDESPAVRHDYHATLNRLFTSNFARLNHEWCDRHGLRFTGHFNEHAWPIPTGSPSTMAAQRWMHAPGLDLLGFQFSPGSLRKAGLWLFGAKEATSIAAQCGRDEVLCESSGGGGYGFAPEQMKPLEDFLLALGINRMVPHLAHQSLAGSRKYDWPQTISDHSPWWDSFATHALHVGRCATLLSTGTTTARTLVLNPTTTGWIRYRPEAYRWPGETDDGAMSSLRESHTSLVTDLYSAQIDFDLGDESVISELGKIHGAQFGVGHCSYSTVVIPPGMENMLQSTAELLQSFLEAGGTVFCAGDAPHYINGRKAVLAATKHPRWIATGENLVSLLHQRHPPRLSAPCGAELPPDLLWNIRQLDCGDAVLFLANHSDQPIRAEIVVAGAGIHACDTLSGQVKPIPQRVLPHDRICGEIDLSPGGHALWWISGQARTMAPQCRQPSVVQPRFEGCEPLEPNLLVLDYCDYNGPGGISRHGVPVLTADAVHWNAQGFEQNLWHVSIQYRRCFLDAPIAQNSKFTVRYHFQIAPGALAHADIQAAIERPWLYDIRCNGIKIAQDGAEKWFDEDMRLIPLGKSLRPGANVLELQAGRFHVLAEIMPVILRGNFHVASTESGFLLETPRPWQTGQDWSSEGAMFYCGRVRYRFSFEIPSASSVLVRLPDYLASAAGIVLENQPLRWAQGPETEMEFFGPHEAGTHSLEVILCGNLKNLLGPHFSDGLPGAWSWREAPESQPAGQEYRFAATGLAGTPGISILPLEK